MTDASTVACGQPDQPHVSSVEWGFVARIGFRFAFCYWLLYCLPSGGGRVSLASFIPSFDDAAWPVWLWHKITPWTAQHLFHLSGMRTTYFPTGSGDTTLEYVLNFLFVVIAAVATFVWSLLDRRRRDYSTLYGWLRILLRLTLALTLFSYGLAKVFPMQFSKPSLIQLTETLGEASPMGLLWTFMGASMPYTIFSGLAETFAASLLVFRRTALLGALVAAGVLLNVVMLNFCYDVPVKLYSTNLLLMALFLLLPDVSRLANVFFFNRVAAPVDLNRPYLPKRWMRIGAITLKFALFAFFMGASAWGGWQYLRGPESDGTPPVYGVYAVDSLNLNGAPAAPGDRANPGWLQVVAERRFWVIRHVDGPREYFGPHFSAKAGAVDLLPRQTGSALKLNYAQPDPQHLVLTGSSGGESLEMHLHRTDKGNFLLTSRGFHWINEYPFNR